MKTLAEILKRIAEIEKEVRAGNVTDALESELNQLLDDKKKAEARQQQVISRFGGLAVIPNGTPTPTDEQKLYRSAWLKSLMGKALSSEESEIFQRAITSGSSSGGAAIPTVTANRIVTTLEQVSILFPRVQKMYVPGLKMPKESATQDAAWVSEGAGTTAGTDTLTSLTWNAYDLIRVQEITSQVQLMSIDAFEDWLVSMLIRKLSRAIDKSIVYGAGSGSNQPTGINVGISFVEGTNLKTTTSASAIAYAEVLAFMGLLPTAYAQGAEVIMSRKMLYTYILSIEDDAKHPIFVVNPENGNSGKLLGYPVTVYDEVEDDEIFFGNLNQYLVNFTKDIEVSKDSSAEFKKALVVYRAHALLDGKLLDTAAFVKLKLHA